MGSSCFGKLAQPIPEMIKYFRNSFLLLFVLCSFVSLPGSAQEPVPAMGPAEAHPLFAADVEHQRDWVDSIYSQMTLEQKVGQLFMVDVFSSQSAAETRKIREYIEKYHLGGIIFSKGGPQQQVKL